MEEHLRSEFNEWARAGRGAKMEQGHRPVGEQAIARMDIFEGARVLDLGCGSGWATRLLAERAAPGLTIGIDIADDMIGVAQRESIRPATDSVATSARRVEFCVASAARLPFGDESFTHVFSMESLYYYPEMAMALAEVRRVLHSGGLFVAVVDLYGENEASHQWITQLRVPVHLLSTGEYRAAFGRAGFTDIQDARIHDPTPIPPAACYRGTSFATHEDYVRFREAGSLMLSGRVDR